jgi:hypothetical protein
MVEARYQNVARIGMNDSRAKNSHMNIPPPTVRAK